MRNIGIETEDIDTSEQDSLSNYCVMKVHGLRTGIYRLGALISVQLNPIA
jgi:hypothetical protein